MSPKTLWVIGSILYLVIGFVIAMLAAAGLSGGRFTRCKTTVDYTCFIIIVLFWPAIIGAIFIVSLIP